MDPSGLLPQGWTPSEELMWSKAECPTCGTKARGDARAWAHAHVVETGHPVQLTLGYDVRDEHWESRLSYERIAEIERIKGNGG